MVLTRVPISQLEVLRSVVVNNTTNLGITMHSPLCPPHTTAVTASRPLGFRRGLHRPQLQFPMTVRYTGINDPHTVVQTHALLLKHTSKEPDDDGQVLALIIGG